MSAGFSKNVRRVDVAPLIDPDGDGAAQIALWVRRVRNEIPDDAARLMPAGSRCRMRSAAVIGGMGRAGGVPEMSAASSGLNRCWWWSASGWATALEDASRSKRATSVRHDPEYDPKQPGVPLRGWPATQSRYAGQAGTSVNT